MSCNKVHLERSISYENACPESKICLAFYNENIIFLKNFKVKYCAICHHLNISKKWLLSYICYFWYDVPSIFFLKMSNTTIIHFYKKNEMI